MKQVGLWACLCLGGALPSAFCQEGAVAPDAKKVIEALIAEHDADKANYPVKFEAFRPRFEAFAKEHRGTDAGFDAELWLLSGTWWSREKGTMHDEADAVTARILEAYPDSPRLGELLDKDYVYSRDAKIALCERFLEKERPVPVRAAAHLCLGKAFAREKSEESTASSRKHFEALRADFAAVPYKSTTYGAMASAHLAPHSSDMLRVDALAPEITGIGIDGKPIKLSDFRGKIVVLDFWGDW
ncbi:MAG: hypothetical protein H6832_11415 [Planctomycetes bacterium]|nr:hypothetical protein [Planctomycetota bacterium]MCB9918999.1 hypothetical protein [Planctomycetota bacterium]